MSQAETRRGVGASLALFAVLQTMQGALRCGLLWQQRAELADPGLLRLGRVLWTGARLDAVISAALTLPALLLVLMPGHGLRDRALRVWSAVALAILALSLCGEIGFFRYYGFRANYLVLEHGADPEVLRTLARHYVTGGWALLLGGLLWGAIALHRRLEAWFDRQLGAHSRARLLALPLVLACGLLLRGTLDHRPINPGAAVIGPDRVENETTASGVFNVAYEWVQLARGARVDLRSVQSLIPRDEAHERARRLLGIPGAVDGADSFARVVSAAPRAGRPLNVVVVVMESFTARLVGSLGGAPALSPQFDALARQGLLLANCYATGERTVQGLEAVLASFPPLPGVSAVRRAEAQTGFATLGTLLAERGYDTLFLYGGQGIFDHMRSFFLGNGFRRFIEEADFERPEFRGSWGVSDGDVFQRANREFQTRWERGVPFLGAILTVSLHAPWEFPRESSPWLPSDVPIPPGFERAELENFLYADHAIGEFMREARGLGYSRDTLFVFVGDHGVHLRGRERLPSEEYRIPALFLAPGLTAGRLEDVTSQMDVAPTILGLLGGEFRSPFFGRDVRADANRPGMAILVYGKRDYGVRRADRLTVLSARGPAVAYRRDGDRELVPTPSGPVHREDARDALALLQVAEELLEQRRYTVARR